jgi:hypothetical protein
MLDIEPVEPGGQIHAAQPDGCGVGEIAVVAGVRVGTSAVTPWRLSSRLEGFVADFTVAIDSFAASIGPLGSAREMARPATKGARTIRLHSSSEKSLWSSRQVLSSEPDGATCGSFGGTPVGTGSRHRNRPADLFCYFGHGKPWSRISKACPLI